MKITVNRPVEIDVAYIQVILPVKYDEEDMPNDFPFRVNDVWTATIEIATGRIFNWPGTKHDFYMKVTDGGSYVLLDSDLKSVATKEQEYVPCCIPGAYGDYVDFTIATDGTIDKWCQFCTPRNVIKSFSLKGYEG